MLFLNKSARGGGGIPLDRIIIPDISSIDISGRDFEYIWNHIESFESVYQMLADDRSKKVFSGILNYKITHDIKIIGEIYDNYENQYFDKHLIKYAPSDVFVDCGGYTGDTIENFILKNRGQYQKIISFEADKENYGIMYSKYKDESKVQLVNAACWNRKCQLHFDNVGSGSGNISINGKSIINTVRIDDVLQGEEVTFLKMDIEGAEYEALLGAYESVVKWHPVLQISVYHRQDDFIRIPLLIKSMYEGYKLYFRHYRKSSVQETVCYAIPGKIEQ